MILQIYERKNCEKARYYKHSKKQLVTTDALKEIGCSGYIAIEQERDARNVIHAVLEAMATSAKEGRWVKVSELAD